MIASKHLRECILRPALDQLRLHTVAREELLVITAAQESLGGRYLMQYDVQGYPKGPALGIFQMEPATYNDLLDNFLKYRVSWVQGLVGPVFNKPDPERMIYDLRYAAVVAALEYYRFSEAIPDDLEGQIRYYKKYWNTNKGKATLSEVRFNYDTYIKAA